MKLTKFRYEHYRQLRDQPGQEYMVELSEQGIIDLELAPHSYSIIADNNLVMAVGGLTQYWEGRSECWIVFNKAACRGPKFIRIHRLLMSVLKRSGMGRIEAAVRCDFDKGKRLVYSLGFILEAKRLRRYQPDGSDCSLFARIT